MRVLLVCALLAVAGCVAPAAFDETPAAAGLALDADGFAPRVFEDGFVFGTLQAAVDPTLVLHAETFLPRMDAPLADGAPERLPAILVMSPYFGAGQMGRAPGHPVYKWLVEELVPRGYAVVLADTAGQGGSSGCWDFMGPNEVRGAVAMVEAIAAQPWSDGAVGMIGKSYDGMTQVMAASRAPGALRTIVPVAPLTHAYAGLYQNGIHYGGGWHATTTAYHQISLEPPVGAAERYPGYAVRALQTPTCAGQNTVLGNDPTGAYNAYFEERDFRPTASAVAASVFYVQGFLDPAVKPDNMRGWWDALTVPKKAWLGHWHHDYPNAELAGREDLFLTLHRWFDSELKGVDNGVRAEPSVDVQDSLGRWRREAAWPPADATTLALHPGDGGVLGAAPGSGVAVFGGPGSLTALVDGRSAGVAAFRGEPLAAPLHVAGSPRLEIDVASDRPGGHLVARLVDVNGSSERLVSQGAVNLQLAGGLSSPEPLVPGEGVRVAIDLYPTDYVVEAGHALELRLLTVDGSLWFDPDPYAATLTATLDGASLALPVVARSDADVFLVACGERLKDAVPSCYREGAKDLGVGA